MDLSGIQTFLHSSTVQMIIVLLAGATGAVVVFIIASSLSLEQPTSRRLGKFAGTIPTGMTEEIGGTVLKYFRRDLSGITSNLDWAQLGGSYEGWTLSTLIGRDRKSVV
jgi:hypothetical protein